MTIEQYLQDVKQRIDTACDPEECNNISSELFKFSNAIKTLPRGLDCGTGDAEYAYLDQIDAWLNEIDRLIEESDKTENYLEQCLQEEAEYGSYNEQVYSQWNGGRL